MWERITLYEFKSVKDQICHYHALEEHTTTCVN